MTVYGLLAAPERERLLLGISACEFSHSIRDLDGSMLYVFSPERELYKAGVGAQRVAIYLKEGEQRCADGMARLLVVSLHPLEMPIYRLFED